MNYVENFCETKGRNKKNEFYPTPKEIASQLIGKLDLGKIETILEPSAGKGDLVEAIQEKRVSKYERAFSVDCIEIDSNLQDLLKGKGYKVIYDDFLSFKSHKKYDLILMNPPFSNGSKHLLKAIELQSQHGGQIACILNSETLKNPYSNERKHLCNLLEKYSARIEYIEHGFSDSERKTDVEIAIVQLEVPSSYKESFFFEEMKKAKQFEGKKEDFKGGELALSDFVQSLIKNFEIEVAAGTNFILEYQKLSYLTKAEIDDGTQAYNHPIIELKISGEDYSSYRGNDGRDYTDIVNKYLQNTRFKYWKHLIYKKDFTSKLTSKLRDKYYGMVSDLSNYDFNEYNILVLLRKIRSETYASLNDAILDLFEEMSSQHSWYPECSNNIHYYNGWATNKAHKINRKVILPFNGFDSWNKSKLSTFTVVHRLADIEKCFNYLDGGRTPDVNLNYVVERAQCDPKNIDCKYFTVTFYKKGTAHLTFKDQDLLDKFNIYAAKNKNWLPPYYGKTSYDEMDEEGKEAVDNFGVDYNKVYENKEFYLQNVEQLMQIA